MLVAELKGKVSETGGPYERMEDVLTSYVFSILFCYLDNLDLPIKILREAQNLDGEKLSLNDIAHLETHFWPRFYLPAEKRTREPDVLLLIQDENGHEIRIVVEAKYYHGKSQIAGYGTDSNSLEADAGRPLLWTGDQLADEYCGVKCGEWQLQFQSSKSSSGRADDILVYVTMHHVLPKPDIGEALEALKKLRQARSAEECCSCLEVLPSKVYWLGWRQVHSMLAEAGRQRYPGYSLAAQRMLEDLQKLLEKRGLVAFHLSHDLVTVGAYLPLVVRGCFTLFTHLESVAPYTGLPDIK